jgi:REP element-mobilizing transposase RayT
VIPFVDSSHRRKNMRLPGFDYASEGAYFVTLVTRNREPLFGEILDNEMRLSEYGKIVEFTWFDLPNHNPDIGLGAFVIMPNHIHGIIHLFSPSIVGAGSKPAHEIGVGYEPTPTKTYLYEIIRQLKTFSAKRISILRGTPGIPIWQRNYYDHIIRSDHAYAAVERYIQDNQVKWAADKENTCRS